MLAWLVRRVRIWWWLRGLRRTQRKMDAATRGLDDAAAAWRDYERRKGS